MQYIVNGENKLDISVVGNKAFNINKMIMNGIRCIHGVVIVDELTVDDKLLLERSLSSEKKYIVRSSMGNEDGEDESSAGKYLTILDVDKNEVFHAIEDVFNSCPNGIRKAALIQEMIYSDVSGVIFTKNPVSNIDNIIIECVLGTGDNLVSGELEPDRYIIDRDTSSVIKSKINKKYYTFLHRELPFNGKTFKIHSIELRTVIFNNNYQLASVACFDKTKEILDKSTIDILISNAKRIENIFNGYQDIEFTIINNEIFFLQARSITGVVEINENSDMKIKANGSNCLYGDTASLGYFSGKIKKITEENISSIGVIDKNTVLLLDNFLPEVVHLINNCGAIIVETGGILCHAAIISREKKIPCIVNIKDVFDLLNDGDEVIVNATEGFICKYFADK